MSLGLVERLYTYVHGTNHRQKWDEFDPYIYQKDHYREITSLDAEVISEIVEFYKKEQPKGEFLEVGAGSNMYPILAALPYAEKIDVWEFSSQNVKYLQEQLVQLDPTWAPWIEKLCELDPDIYGSVNFQTMLQEKVKIIQGNIFDLPKNKYNNVSMHSVAESLTGRTREFKKAVNKITCAGKPGSTLVTTFVENSQSYTAGREFFALPIEAWDAVRLFGSQMDSLHFGNTAAELRPGSRLIMAMGRRKK